MCGKAAPGYQSLGLPLPVFPLPEQYPVVSLSAELHTLPVPAQVLCLHAAGRVSVCSEKQLSDGVADFSLSVLILVGAVEWGLYSEPSPQSILG